MKNKMHKEFELLESRYVFRFEHILDEEIKWWKLHLSNEGFDINNKREIFEPFYGESARYLNEEVGTNELRIRKWQWIDNLGIKHNILDMNNWPGDNESGIIVMDQNHILNNSDTDLTEEDDIIPERFLDRIDFFSKLRVATMNHEQYEDILDDYFDDTDEDQEDYDILLFMTTQSGKNSIKVEKDGYEKYRKEVNDIYKEHNRLESLYLKEFVFLFNIKNDCDLASKLNYEPKQIINDRCPNYTFIKWIYNGNEYLLVSISDNFHNETYLLDSFNLINIPPIKYKLLRTNYLSEDYDDNNELLTAFKYRVYSYILLRNNIGNYSNF